MRKLVPFWLLSPHLSGLRFYSFSSMDLERHVGGLRLLFKTWWQLTNKNSRTEYYRYRLVFVTWGRGDGLIHMNMLLRKHEKFSLAPLCYESNNCNNADLRLGFCNDSIFINWKLQIKNSSAQFIVLWIELFPFSK